MPTQVEGPFKKCATALEEAHRTGYLGRFQEYSIADGRNALIELIILLKSEEAPEKVDSNIQTARRILGKLDQKEDPMSDEELAESLTDICSLLDTIITIRNGRALESLFPRFVNIVLLLNALIDPYELQWDKGMG